MITIRMWFHSCRGHSVCRLHLPWLCQLIGRGCLNTSSLCWWPHKGNLCKTLDMFQTILVVATLEMMRIMSNTEELFSFASFLGFYIQLWIRFLSLSKPGFIYSVRLRRLNYIKLMMQQIKYSRRNIFFAL